MDGKIIIVDQLSFCTPDYSPFPSSTVPLVGGILDSYVSVGTYILKVSSLLGYFTLSPLEVWRMVSMVSNIPHDPNNC